MRDDVKIVVYRPQRGTGSSKFAHDILVQPTSLTLSIANPTGPTGPAEGRAP